MGIAKPLGAGASRRQGERIRPKTRVEWRGELCGRLAKCAMLVVAPG